MFTNKEYDLFKRFTEVDGISGYEGKVASLIKKELLSIGVKPNQFFYDKLGSLIVKFPCKDENAKNVMVDAHMDEVGFLTSHIKENGVIELLALGFHYPELIKNQLCRVDLGNGQYVEGTILVDESNPNQDSMSLDIKVNSKEGAIEKGIKYGQEVYFVSPLEKLEESLYQSKAFDDRYGVVLNIELIEYILNKDLPFNLYVSFTTQEEVGLRGITTALNVVNPDLCIALDCSRANPNNVGFGRIGEGVLIRYFDRAMVAFKELLDFQVAACEQSNSKYQYFSTGGGTNAGKMHMHNNGVPTLTHCICGKDIHTGKTIISSDDYQAAKNSLFKIIDNLTKENIDKLLEARKW